MVEPWNGAQNKNTDRVRPKTKMTAKKQSCEVLFFVPVKAVGGFFFSRAKRQTSPLLLQEVVT